MVSLLFSFKGRATRLQYFLVSVVAVYLPLFALVAIFFGMVGAQATSADAASMMSANAGGIAIFFIAGFLVWVVCAIWWQLAIMVKRSRDAGFGSWFRWTYVAALFVGPFIPLVNIAAGLFTFCSFWVLLLKTGTNEGFAPEIDAFGPRPTSDSAGPIAGSMADIDLVARAAALRPVEAATTPSRPRPARAAGAAPRGFGRRTQPAFGKR